MSISRIALYHLETLLWIARLGTFGAAAERLNTTQPAISARVRELENLVGKQLFRREGRTMTLTPAGRQLVRESEPLVARFQDIMQGASSIADSSGIVRIGAGEIAAASCLPGFVAGLQQELPNVSLEIEIALTADLIQQILTGRTDLVFGAGRIAHPALRTTPIGTVDLLLLASPATVEALKSEGDVGRFPLWSLSSHSPLYQIMKEAISRTGLASRTVNLCNNARMMIDIVMAGDGIGIFPSSMVQQLLAEGRLEPIPGATDIPPVEFQVAIRAAEMDPLILHIFERACGLDISELSLPAITAA
jgi:DNA-binding transcriptional LysR family regulator